MHALEAAFDSGDPVLLKRFRKLAADHLEVIAGDIGEPNLGLDKATWDRLAYNVDQIVHPAALVNHVLPYNELFGPNVRGHRRDDPAGDHRPDQADHLPVDRRGRDVCRPRTTSSRMADIREVSPVRPVDSSYASGYANSKWAGEVLLREAHDLCGLPVAVFRSDMILRPHADMRAS